MRGMRKELRRNLEHLMILDWKSSLKRRGFLLRTLG